METSTPPLLLATMHSVQHPQPQQPAVLRLPGVLQPILSVPSPTPPTPPSPPPQAPTQKLSMLMPQHSRLPGLWVPPSVSSPSPPAHASGSAMQQRFPPSPTPPQHSEQAAFYGSPKAATAQQQQLSPGAEGSSDAHPVRKKKTNRACSHCQRSHMPCDPGRPCERCVKRGLAESCRDGPRKKTKYEQQLEQQQHRQQQQPNPYGLLHNRLGLSGSSSSDELQSVGKLFSSNALNREFSALSDIVTAPIDTSAKDQDADLAPELGITTAPYNTTELSSDSVYDRVTEPYSYSQGFHHLLSFARQRMDKDDMLRICKALVSFRPPFIATVTNLSRQDLVFMEKCFQRTVLEFNKLLTSIGTPTCVWRRTGELALVSKEFSLLTQWSVEDLLGKSTYIYELMDNRATVDYWEKYASVVLDNAQQSVITKCTLIRPDKTTIPCTACYTIKRDIFDVPLCVVGNFLPILNTSKW